MVNTLYTINILSFKKKILFDKNASYKKIRLKTTVFTTRCIYTT